MSLMEWPETKSSLLYLRLLFFANLCYSADYRRRFSDPSRDATQSGEIAFVILTFVILAVTILLFIWGKLRPDYRDIRLDGCVYRIDLDMKEIKKIDSRIRFPNGIVFGPDDYLYVSETLTGMVYRYKWEDSTIVGGREDFSSVIDPQASRALTGPDGMKFGKDGNLYVTVYGQGEVIVLGKDGEVIRRIKTEGSLPTNCAFGPAGSKKLYVTEDELGTLEVHDVDTDGFQLYNGQRRGH